MILKFFLSKTKNHFTKEGFFVGFDNKEQMLIFRLTVAFLLIASLIFLLLREQKLHRL